MPSLVSILEQTVSPNGTELKDAQEYLEQAAETNFSEFLIGLCTVLANPHLSQVARMASALQMKNYLTSREFFVRQQYQLRWLALEEKCRTTIRQLVLQSLGTETSRPSCVAQVIASIACAEVPLHQWEGLMPRLVLNITSTESSELLRESTLETIGYICCDMERNHLAHHSNEILTAIVHGLRKEESSLNVKLAAANAMLNSLEFSANNFDKEVERNVIMQVLCELSQVEDAKVKVVALQCLVKIVSLYYHHMEPYMGPALFSITMAAMQSDDDDVCMQGIEFWTNVCEEEMELAEDLSDALEIGSLPSNTSKFYAKGALQYLIPILTNVLIRQEEVPTDDDWNPAKAASVCITFFASLCGDDVIPQALPFVFSNISCSDWRYRDAAVMTFGSILSVPNKDNIVEIVHWLVPTLVGMLMDGHVAVRDSTAWAMGRICQLVPSAVLKEDTLSPLLCAMVECLNHEPRAAAHICLAFSSLASSTYSLSDSLLNERVTSAMTAMYERIVEKLLHITDRIDGHHDNLRTAAYEAMMEFIKCSPKGCYETVLKTTTIVMGRIHAMIMLEPQVQSSSDRAHYNAIQSLLCGALQTVLKKVKKAHVISISDTVMVALLHMMKSSKGASIVQEDALMTIGTLVQVTGSHFIKYLEAFKDYLMTCLQDADEYEVFVAAVGVVSDLCRTIRKHILPLCDDIMMILLNCLSGPEIYQSVKPNVLSTIGDIALALGDEFKKYLEPVLQALQQAASTQIEKPDHLSLSPGACRQNKEKTDGKFRKRVRRKTDYNSIGYLNELRESCLGAYTGIVQGLKGDDPKDVKADVGLMAPHIPFILTFLETIAEDPYHSDGTIAGASGLIGDLCAAYGKAFGADIVRWVEAKTQIIELLSEGRHSKISKTKRLARWSSEQIGELKHSCPRLE